MPRRSPRSRAEAQRVRYDANRLRLTFTACSEDFENEMRALNYRICSRCRKRTKNSDVVRDLCGFCRRSHSNPFTAENNMDFGTIPPELKSLSLIEEILIARVHPVVSVFKIRGQQRAYSGHVMNFTQHIEQIASRLPHDPGSLSAILLLNRNTPSGLIQFRVRSHRVRNALIWLKNNNQYYHDITIDENILRELPIDGDVSQLLPNLPIDDLEDGENLNFDNLIDRSCFPNLPTVDAGQVIEQNLRHARRDGPEQLIEFGAWPDLDQNPANEFSSEGLICKAFPVLFPYGRGDIRAPRLQSITKHNYFKYLMQYHDGRFANDARFPYYAYNTLARWDALNCGSVYVRKNRLEGLNAEDLIDMVNDENLDLASSIMYYGSNLRGTRPYWKQRCSELIQMVRQLGTPTIFFTLSAADYHWPDLFRILCPDTDSNLLDEKQRATLMHENPATVAWFFELRCDAFIKKFLTKFFSITDFWYRFEWQFRGSPHIHGLLWLNDAPDCCDIDAMGEGQKASIVRYFDRLVSAWLNQRYVIPPQVNPCRKRLTDIPEAEWDLDLDRLLSAVQRHSRCGAYCLRRKRGSRMMVCRFGFPIEVEPVSTLRLDAGSWKFIPKRNDSLLQRYNRFVTQVWRGNTDFMAITSKDAVINYISKYASKGEHASDAFSDILQRLLRRSPDETPASTLVRKLLVSSVAERNYSAQEVMHLLMGWPLYHSSRSVILVSLREEWQRVGEDARSTLVSHYSNRDVSLAGISLFQYAKNYRVASGRTIKRRKECIVRVMPYLKLTDDISANEEYYKLQCKLHIPWRQRFEDLLPEGLSWHDVYIRNLEDIDDSESFTSEWEVLPEDIEFEPDHGDPRDVVRDAAMAASRLHPGSQVIDPLGQRPIDEAYNWNCLSRSDLNLELINDFLRSYRQAPGVQSMREPGIDFNSLSREQQEIVRLVTRQVSNPSFPIKRLIVQGKAGTGKSAVIRAMCRVLDEYQLLNPGNGYQVVAPTGAAAMNIDGKTIHNFLRIPANGPLHPLNGDSLRCFQLQLQHLRFIIIDEYSMIGLRLLNKIHKRLCEARGSATEPFGGYFIYLFGDLRQLPPVRDLAIYMDPNDDFSRFGSSLISTFQKKIVLTICHRQDDSQFEFKQLLDSIATGTVTQQGWNLLMTRRSATNPANIDAFRGSIHLFPTNIQVSEFNKQVLSDNQHPVAIVEAEHNNATARQGTDDQAQGLTRRLYISIGCRVMLRKNLCVGRGLVNGSLGTVRDIVYFDNDGPPSLPCTLLIEFDRYSGPFIRNNYFPLLPIHTTWRDQGVDCDRRQFPLTIAYALTIHKSQGLTLEKAVVDIGPKESSVGLSYVALSRVRRLEDLLISKPFDYQRLSGLGQMKHIVERERFIREILADSCESSNDV